MNKNLKILFIALLALAVAAPAMAAKITAHGDLDNRMLVYTDQINFFSSNSASNTELSNDDAPDTFATAKYRLWTKMETNDGNTYGVYAIEFGGLRFGSGGTGKASGGSFSGDGINIETRWAYTDFQLPSVDTKARFRIGLFSNNVNKNFWAESAMGVKFYTDNWYIAWLRGDDRQAAGGDSWGDGDLDTLSARYDMKLEPAKVGLFLSYFWQDTQDDVSDFSSFNTFTSYALDDINIDTDFYALTFGVDGSWGTATNQGKFFVNWDVMYQIGEFNDVSGTGLAADATDMDLAAYFAHLDVGLNFGKATVTYTLYYASGDDNPNDDDLDGWLGADTDASFSVIMNEGGYTNDDYFTDRYYIADKGIIVNKLALDYKATKKTKIGVAVLLLQTAEDMEWNNVDQFGTPGVTNTFADDSIGVELDAYISHKLYKNLTLAWNFGFLSSDDATDAFEPAGTRNGSGDVDVFRSTARARLKF